MSRNSTPRGRGFFSLLWAVIFAVGACAASKVKYSIIDQGVHSGKQSPSLRFEVVDREALFEALFTEIHSDQLPPPSPPKIDFEKSLVVFVSTEEKPSAGYRIVVDEVTRDDETLRVKIRVEAPPRDQFQATVMTRPYVLIKIKKEPEIEKIALVDDKGNVVQSLPIR
ncbi:MAG: protease complex subunit PrcB family protein [Candidatus Manganitrophus sp.]|nr:protease complex subunit PrcB family protein [Candidatus Manganitrophus sp.]